MVFIRAAECIQIGRMERAAQAYPHLASLTQVGDPNTRVGEAFTTIKTMRWSWHSR